MPATGERLLRLAAPLLLIGMLAGCKRGPENQPLFPDQKFSVNVVATPAYWPREKFDYPDDPLSRDAQVMALSQHGRPDYIRFVHTVDRRLIRPLEIEEGHTLPGRLEIAETEWVYYNDRKVIAFRGPKVEERELDDALATVCLYGDPNEVKVLDDNKGDRISYTYYNHGKTFTFTKGKLTNTYEFKPMPGFEMRN